MLHMSLLVFMLRESYKEFQKKTSLRLQWNIWYIVHNISVCCLPIPILPIFKKDVVSLSQ